MGKSYRRDPLKIAGVVATLPVWVEHESGAVKKRMAVVHERCRDRRQAISCRLELDPNLVIKRRSYVRASLGVLAHFS